MENIGVEITSVVLENEKIVLKYANDAIETLPVNEDTFKLFREKWIIPNPPFISDRFKSQMKDIVHTCVHCNEKCCNNLKAFFRSPNEAEVLKFFTYMRKRDEILPAERAKWKIVEKK
jgi:hypothetical protein